MTRQWVLRWAGSEPPRYLRDYRAGGESVMTKDIDEAESFLAFMDAQEIAQRSQFVGNWMWEIESLDTRYTCTTAGCGVEIEPGRCHCPAHSPSSYGVRRATERYTLEQPSSPEAIARVEYPGCAFAFCSAVHAPGRRYCERHLKELQDIRGESPDSEPLTDAQIDEAAAHAAVTRILAAAEDEDALDLLADEFDAEPRAFVLPSRIATSY